MTAGIPLTPDIHSTEQRTAGSRRYAIIVCIFASLGGMFFGYDQGVTGGVLVMDSFLDDFCRDLGKIIPENCRVSSSKLPNQWLTFSTLYNVMYYLGCIVGAFFGGWVADRCGRRVTIFTAGLLFSIGTLWVVLMPAGEHEAVLVGRIIQGMGVGNSSFSLPLFGAEMAPKELRGFLSGFMQMTVVTGLLLANVVNLAVEHTSEGWRITNAIAMIPPLIVMIGIFCVPESPRWVYKHRGRDKAQADLVQLRMTEHVTDELDAIGEQLALEGDAVAWKELWQPSVRRRVMIATALQLLQQATGINPVFTYGGQIFKDVTGNGILSLLILTIVNFLSTIPAMRWVDTFGRRQLLLIGAVGMCLGHLVAAITFTAGCTGNTEHSGCSKGAGYVIIIATSFFVFNFAISWGPVCWIYPAEIFPLNVRAKAVSLSTMTNWAMGALMIGIPKLFPYLNIHGVFFLFSGLCIVCGVFVYCMCPETKGILLEEIEVLFHGYTPHKTSSESTVTTTKSHPSPKYEGMETPSYA